MDEQIICIDGAFYVLNQDSWNGEIFVDCPVALDKFGIAITSKSANLRPVYNGSEIESYTVETY